MSTTPLDEALLAQPPLPHFEVHLTPPDLAAVAGGQYAAFPASPRARRRRRGRMSR